MIVEALSQGQRRTLQSVSDGGTLIADGRFVGGAAIPVIFLCHKQPEAAQTDEARRQQQLQERLAQEARERERLVAEARERDRLQAARPTAPRQERRVALVDGNAAYTNQPLANPVNDATDVAASLRAMGFETTLLRDATSWGFMG